MENEINWLSLLLAALVPMVMGFIYYHKALFGNVWMKDLGLTEEKIKESNMAVIFGVSFVMSLLIAFFMLNFCNGAGQEGVFDSYGHGAAHGAIISGFLIIPIFITNGLFEQKSWTNMLINAGYWIITLAAMGAIVDGMNHFKDAAGM